MSTENLLKRKNEEDAISEEATSTIKRVALDADAIEEESSELELQVEGNGEGGPSSDEHAKISSHKVRHNIEDDDPTYTYFRMLCQVKEAALVVGKGGEKIKHIKDVCNTRVNVSENILGVTERIIHVRGSAENVAKTFGLISRAILNEEENVPSGLESTQFDLKLLIPHQIMGYIIGKSGLKLREIEDKSAAKLSASPNSMPFSTDRCLNIIGVADAIHIATYYTAQTILENKANFKGTYIYYNPGSVQGAQLGPHGLPPNPMMFNPMNFGGMPPQMSPNQFGLGYEFNPSHNNNRTFNVRNNNHHNNNNRPRNQHNNNHFQQQRPQPQMPTQQKQAYDISLPGGPHVVNGGFPIPQNGQVVQDIYIPNEYVGNIIGRGGKNLKNINETTGSRITVNDPDPNSKERRITITGSTAGNQTAVFLINNKIDTDMRSNKEKAHQQQMQWKQQQQQQQQSAGSDGNDDEEIIIIEDDDKRD